MNKKMMLLLLVVGLAGCTAAQYRPVIDPSVCTNCNYERDLSECQRIGETNTSLVGSAATGAAVGAGLFAVLGAIAGVDAGTMAAIGATVGGVQSAGGEAQASRGMVARCMAGRGYSVLR